METIRIVCFTLLGVALAVGVSLALLWARRAVASRKRKKTRRTSDLILLVLALFLLAFVVCMIVTFWVKGAVPDTLIQCTMGCGGVEALAMAFIKISKTLKGEKSDETETLQP